MYRFPQTLYAYVLCEFKCSNNLESIMSLKRACTLTCLPDQLNLMRRVNRKNFHILHFGCNIFIDFFVVVPESIELLVAAIVQNIAG